MRRLAAVLLTLFLVARGFAQAPAEKPLLLQQPTVNKTHIVFAFADDLWSVPRDGGNARRLTSGDGVETDPMFSPDGKRVAFTGEYEGNTDVYVVPAGGGEPRRLTYHPGSDRATGWTPDGKRVLFQSSRNSYSRFTRLFTMPADGGHPDEVPLPMAYEGVFSPDGKHMAYVPFSPAFRSWKRYRGGRATPVWIARLEDSHIEKIPRKDSNDFNPMWLGHLIYFLSDRDGPMTLYVYDTESKKVRRVLENNGLDLKSASAGPDIIVYEQFGAIHLLDPKTEKPQKVSIRVNADLPNLRPRFVEVGRQVRGAALSPTGVRAVFEARGEVLTVPAKKGNVRNLTNSTGTAERDPAWSPDGQRIAYFSDASGEYELHLCPQTGMGEVKKYKLGQAPSFYYSPVWSPDGKKIAYTDKRLNTWYIDLDSGKSTLVDSNYYAPRMADPSWSPDSRWLAYSKKLKNHMNAIFLYSLEKGQKHQVTDGMSDARMPAFDRGGKYLYFTASTDAGPSLGGIEMSNYNYPVTRSVYVVVLSKDEPSPLAPQSDEEKGAAQKKSAGRKKPGDPKDDDAKDGEKKEPEKKEATPVRIDLEDIDQRILALPMPARNYVGLMAGKAGVFFLAEVPEGSGRGRMVLHKFEMDKRKADEFLEGISSATVSHDGEKLLVRRGGGRGRGGDDGGRGGSGGWAIVSTSGQPKSGEGTLRLSGMEVKIDPRAEWRQMYDEVWRIERDFLYDPGFHGLDLEAAAKKYRPYLEHVAGRNDLNYLFSEMLGELSLGHVYIRGGDTPEVERVRGGLLGADYKVENDRYRFAKIYRGENWNPGLRAPLTEPGVNVKQGDYLLAVNGQEVKAADSLYRFFEGTAGKSVILRVGPTPDGKNARDVTVVPIDSETSLRNRDWIEANRRKVDKLSKGRVAYVYLPNTSTAGYENFNRYYYAQAGKEGAVIDERFNGGGKAADYMITRMSTPLMNMWSTREGADYTTPAGAIFGAKAMIINEMAGSGGDWLPWAFRRFELGPLVGKRTWGGLVGIGGYPSLIDGGSVTAPHFAFWTPEGKWEVENKGVAPDVEVEFDPELVRAGRDPQLEKAVELVLKELEKNPVKLPKRPAYPNYHKEEKATSGGRR